MEGKRDLQFEFMTAGNMFITEVIQPMEMDLERMKKNPKVTQEKISERTIQIKIAIEFYNKCEDIIKTYQHVAKLQQINNLLIEDYANFVEKQALKAYGISRQSLSNDN